MLLFSGTLNIQFKNDSEDQSESQISLFNQCQCLGQESVWWEQLTCLSAVKNSIQKEKLTNQPAYITRL